MATKVNTKFIVILAVAIVGLVAGAAGLFVWSNVRSAERNILNAQEFEQEAAQLFEAGNDDEAYRALQRAMTQRGVAVSKQPTNIEYLRNWIDALLATRPTNPDLYRENYNEYFQGLNLLAERQPSDIQAQYRFINTYLENTRRGAGPGNASQFGVFANAVSDRLERVPFADEPEGQLMRGLRGYATAQRMFATSIPEEEREAAREDLDAALNAAEQLAQQDDPGIPRFEQIRELVAAARIRWAAAQVRSYLAESRPRLATETYEQQRDTVAELTERFDQSIPVALARLTFALGEPGTRTLTDAQTDARTERINALRADILDRMLEAEPGDIDVFVLQDFLSFAIPAGRLTEVADFARSVPDLFPGDPAAPAIAAVILERLGDLEGAIALNQTIVDMPLPELSIEGRDLTNRRISARLAQASLAAMRYRRTNDPQTRQAVLEDAKRYLEEASENAGVAFENQVKLVQAEIDLIEGRTNAARVAFSDLRADLGDNPRVLVGLARASAALGNLDAAADAYERVVGIDPEDIPAGIDGILQALELADVYARNNQFEQALGLVSAVRERFNQPNEVLAQREAAIQALLAEEIRSEIARVEDEIAAVRPGTATANSLNQQLEALRAQLDTIVQEADLPPEIEILGAAQRAAAREGISSAVQIIRQGLAQYPDSPALHDALVRALFTSGDMQATERALADAEQRFPNLALIERLRERFDARDQDPYEVAVQSVRESDQLSPAQQDVQIARIAMNFDRIDEARAALARALDADPDNPEAVELAFSMAVAENPPNLQRARELRDTAVRINADNLEGLTFEARLASAEGDTERAIELFSEATDRLPSEPRLWRFLGIILAQNGRPLDAIDAFERSLQGNASDVQTVRAYAATLQSVGRSRDALRAIGPDSTVFSETQSDPALRNLWLTLEEEAGNAERARRERARIFESNPRDGRNSLAYFQLLLNQGDPERARQVLGTVQADPELTDAFVNATGQPEQLALARARVLVEAAAGDPAPALDRFRSRLTELAQETQSAEPFVSYADLVLRLRPGSAEAEQNAFEALEQGRQYQTAANLEADVAIAAFAQQRGRALLDNASAAIQNGDEQAADVFRERAVNLGQRAAAANQRIIDSGTVSGDALTTTYRRLARTFVQLGRFADARSAVERTLDANPDDLDALLLKASIEEDAGDLSAARQTLDAAVAAHPDDPRPFLARAVINQSVPELAPDVLADLDTVHRLRPSNTQAWRLRFQVLTRQARVQRAFADLRQAIEENPSAAPALRSLLVNLYRLSGQTAQATEVAINFADEDPENLQWQAIAGQLAAEAQRYREAQRCFRRIYESTDLPDDSQIKQAAAAGLLDAILRNQANPVPGEILELLDASEPIAEGNPSVIMLRARAREELGERDRSLALIQDALDVAGDNLTQLRAWREALPLVVGEQAADRYVSRIIGSGNAPLYFRLIDLQRTARSGAPFSEIIQRGTNLLQTARDEANDPVAVEISKLLVPVLYANGQPERAVEVGRAAVELAPRDPQLNNDTAYILATELGDYNAALPYAETAYSVAQEDAAILDTVGVVYRGVGRTQQARQILLQARDITNRDDLLLPIYLHLAQVAADLDDNQNARDNLREAERLAQRVPDGLQQRYRPQIDELRTQLQ